jgi:hypothetical protein
MLEALAGQLRVDDGLTGEASSTSYNRPVGSVKAADHPINLKIHMDGYRRLSGHLSGISRLD